jgi:hypothetical protein
MTQKVGRIKSWARGSPVWKAVFEPNSNENRQPDNREEEEGRGKREEARGEF